MLRIILEVLEVVLGQGQHGMLRHLGRSPPRRTTDDVPDHQMTRGDGHVLAGRHDALEDLDS